LNRLGTRTLQTDKTTDKTTDRQTDGRAIAYSEREREFTFAKKCAYNLTNINTERLQVCTYLLYADISGKKERTVAQLYFSDRYDAGSSRPIELKRSHAALSDD